MTPSEQSARFVKEIGASVMAITGGFYLVDEKGADKGDMLTFACSAFAMSFGGRRLLMTAGHVIKDILDPIIVHNRYLGNRLRVVEANLIDYLGPNPVYAKPTPFPVYPDLPRTGIDESLQRDSYGLDFGIILLPDLYWRGFSANDGRIIAEDMWAEEDEAFDVYKMVGIPAEPGLAQTGQGRLGVYSFLKAADPDVRAPDGKPVWFVGNMPMGVTTVEGISGGPIFGLRKTPEGWEHKIVAMQSLQKGGADGLIYGTPLRSLALVVTHLLGGVADPECSSAQTAEEG